MGHLSVSRKKDGQFGVPTYWNSTVPELLKHKHFSLQHNMDVHSVLLNEVHLRNLKRLVKYQESRLLQRPALRGLGAKRASS